MKILFIKFKRGLSFLFNSPKPEKVVTPLALAAATIKIVNSSIVLGTNDVGQLMDFKVLLFTTISPTFSPYLVLIFIIFIVIFKPI